MIYSVTANKKSFHPAFFKKGLNLIVAKRSGTSSETDFRNARGKSTLLQIIDFCLGSDVNKDGTLPAQYLSGWIFYLELDIRGQRVKVSRSVDDHKLVAIDGDVSGWPILPDGLALGGVHTYTVEQWNKIIGWAFFDLPVKKDKSQKDEDKLSMPSTRSLMHFFNRRSFENALSPAIASANESISIAYLLGLNWEYISRINALKSDEKKANTIGAAAKLQLEKWKATELSLRGNCNYLESTLKEIQEQLPKLNVIPGYAEIEKKVNQMTKEIHGLTNKLISEQARLDAATVQLRKSQEALLPVEEVYQQCGLTFPDVVKEELDRVKEFHETITGNRRIILNAEIRRLRKSIKETRSLILKKSEEKRSAMQVLKTSTALEEYTKMTQRYADLSRELQSKLDCLQHIAEAKSGLESIMAKKSRIADDARIEYEDLRPIWDKSETFFNSLIKELSNKNATLGIKMVGEKKTWGFSFNPAIIDSGSGGIKKFMIYAFDMTLFHQQRVCQHPIDFLIHDSELFDSTDPKLVVNALLAADRIARAMDGQYIYAINSDKLFGDDFIAKMPREKSKEFTALELLDTSDEERVLGIAFGKAIEAPQVAPESTATSKGKE